MNSGKRSKMFFSAALLLVWAAAKPGSVLACAACYGQDSGPMAQGMNWGIFSLLGVIVSVLAGVAGFFIYLARRSAPEHAPAVPEQLAGSTEGI
jgi:heme/copper-type cytochrome/quinol oxidase subunit 2